MEKENVYVIKHEECKKDEKDEYKHFTYTIGVYDSFEKAMNFADEYVKFLVKYKKEDRYFVDTKYVCQYGNNYQVCHISLLDDKKTITICIKRYAVNCNLFEDDWINH